MPETPFPDVEELFDNAPLVVGGVGDAQAELVRRLGYHLPRLTVEYNARRGYTGTTALPVPVARDVLPAPAMLVDKHIGKVLVGAGTSFRDFGPGAFATDVTVIVSSIDARIESDGQVKELWDRSDLVVIALFAYLTGCDDATGKRVWRQLIPQGVTALQGEWAREFSGTRAIFRLVQSPNLGGDGDNLDDD